MTITINTPDTPAYVEVALRSMERRPLNANAGVSIEQQDRDNARAVLRNLSVQCDDPNARALFAGLYLRLKGGE